MDTHEHVRQLFYSAVERYPHSKLSDSAKVEYQSDWLRLADAVGVERFEAALATARLNCSFIPQASEINEYMPPPDLGRRSKHDPECAVCGGTGWLITPIQPGGKNTQAQRCKGVGQAK
jgi:hypothetical protein